MRASVRTAVRVDERVGRWLVDGDLARAPRDEDGRALGRGRREHGRAVGVLELRPVWHPRQLVLVELIGAAIRILGTVNRTLSAVTKCHVRRALTLQPMAVRVRSVDSATTHKQTDTWRARCNVNGNGMARTVAA
jgi:hypothetical protein